MACCAAAAFFISQIVLAFVQRDGFGQLVTQGPAESTRRGPILTDASYPEVLVARAFSRGEDLELT